MSVLQSPPEARTVQIKRFLMFLTPQPKVATPFMDANQISMAELITRIMDDLALKESRRRNVASSIRTFCRCLRCDVRGVPANFWYFRQRLKRFEPISANIRAKHWATI